MKIMQPGAAGKYADGVYDRNAPGFRDGMYPYLSGSGYSSNEERLVSEALAAQTVPAAAIRSIRPQFARMPLFPPRFGYVESELTIDDVIEVDRRYPDSSSQFSGNPGGAVGSSTPSLGWW